MKLDIRPERRHQTWIIMVTITISNDKIHIIRSILALQSHHGGK